MRVPLILVDSLGSALFLRAAVHQLPHALTFRVLLHLLTHLQLTHWDRYLVADDVRRVTVVRCPDWCLHKRTARILALVLFLAEKTQFDVIESVNDTQSHG